MNTGIMNIQMWMSIGQTLTHSLWLGLIFWFMTWFVLQCIPKNRPEDRYWILVSSVILFFASICRLLLTNYADGAYKTTTSFANEKMEFYWKTITHQMDSYVEYSYSSTLIFGWLWFLGMLFMLFRFSLAFVYTYWLGYKSPVLTDPYIVNTISELKDKLGIIETVTIKVSDKVNAIFTYGLVKPIIIWPMALINNLDEEEASMIIAHELMHISRKDFMVKVILSFINTVLYYHPFIWWANRMIDAEREYACDLGAIKLCSTQTQYAYTLVKLQELKLNLSSPIANGFTDNKNFSNRIKRIFNMPIQNNYGKAKLITLLLILTSFGLFAFEYNKNVFVENQSKESAQNIEITKGVLIQPTGEMAATRDSTPSKKVIKSTQIITKIEGDKSTTIKMENGKVVDVEVNGEKINESEFDKYTNEDSDIIKFRKRRGVDSEDYDSQERSILRLKQKLDDDFGVSQLFTFKKLENIDSIFSEGFKNLNFNFRQPNIDSIFGKHKILGFGDDRDGIYHHIDSFLNGFKFRFDHLDDGSIILDRVSPEKRERRNEGEPRGRLFDFIKSDKMSLTKVLEKQLKKDGLLKSGKSNKVELNHKQLKINGEKMPEVIFEKYKKIYEDETGLTLIKGNQVVFNVEHTEKNSKEYKTF